MNGIVTDIEFENYLVQIDATESLPGQQGKYPQMAKTNQSLPKLTKFKPPTMVVTTLLSSTNQSSTSSTKSDPLLVVLPKGLSSCKRAYNIHEDELDDIWNIEEASMASRTSSETVIRSSPSKISDSHVDANAQIYESYSSKIEKCYAVETRVPVPNTKSFETGSGCNNKRKKNIWGDSDSEGSDSD